tara:strand:- start:340 stop:780 length:441 start_codon:yes stop_codon:yes gene_type:complete
MTQLRNATVARLTLMLVLFISTGAAIAAPVQARLYHNPGCMCCEQYADYLNAKGYEVDVLDTDDMAALNEKHGVEPALSSCHTTLIGDYVVVGHVPEPVVAKLLREEPDIRGIALPGMPSGSPGMPGKKSEPFVIKTLKGDVYTTY